MWTEIAENIRLAGGVPVKVGIFEGPGGAVSGYTAQAIAQAITPKTTAIFVNSPHNPTGLMIPEAELRAIVALARERGLWLIADEAYEDIQFVPSGYCAGSDPYERCISLFSMSKSHAMSGLRVGYVVVREARLQDRMAKLLRCVINGVNSLAQWAAVAALDTDYKTFQPMMLEEYARRRDVFQQTLAGIDGLRPFRPEGSFFIWAQVEPRLLERLGLESVDALSDWLAGQGIGSTPGSAFSDRYLNYIRFSFSCSLPMVEGGLRRLQALLQPQHVPA
jgi:aspartate aminotransferase